MLIDVVDIDSGQLIYIKQRGLQTILHRRVINADQQANTTRQESFQSNHEDLVSQLGIDEWM